MSENTSHLGGPTALPSLAFGALFAVRRGRAGSAPPAGRRLGAGAGGRRRVGACRRRWPRAVAKETVENPYGLGALEQGDLVVARHADHPGPDEHGQLVHPDHQALRELEAQQEAKGAQRTFFKSKSLSEAPSR